MQEKELLNSISQASEQIGADSDWFMATAMMLMTVVIYVVQHRITKKATKEVINSAVKPAIEHQNSVLKLQENTVVLLEKQIELQRDESKQIKEAIDVIREDGKKRSKESEQLYSVMNAHIEELKYHSSMIDDHELRISKIESNK